MDKEVVSKIMAQLAKISHEKSPRSKDHYREMQRKSVESKRKKKLSTV